VRKSLSPSIDKDACHKCKKLKLKKSKKRTLTESPAKFGEGGRSYSAHPLITGFGRRSTQLYETAGSQKATTIKKLKKKVSKKIQSISPNHKASAN